MPSLHQKNPGRKTWSTMPRSSVLRRIYSENIEYHLSYTSPNMVNKTDRCACFCNLVLQFFQSPTKTFLQFCLWNFSSYRDLGIDSDPEQHNTVYLRLCFLIAEGW